MSHLTLTLRTIYILFMLSVAAPAVQSACFTQDQVVAFVSDWSELRPLKGLDTRMSPEDGMCSQRRFVAGLSKTLGKAVGYKAGLTNRAVQQRFDYFQPIRGVLLEKMLLADGAEIPAKFGARPVFEADLVVEVKDEGINDAKTPREVLRHVSRIYPFIELPDLVVAEGEPLSGSVLVAINAGARLGVLGRPIPAEPSATLVNALAQMSVITSDQDGKVLAEGRGAAVLDHPLYAVVWLAADLAKSGERLRAGDLLSLGSFSPLLPPKPGSIVKVRYEGLPGNPGASVRFR